MGLLEYIARMIYCAQNQWIKNRRFILFLDHPILSKPEKGSIRVEFRAAIFSGLALPIPFRVLLNIGYSEKHSR
jgi:hypothetical protein